MARPGVFEESSQFCQFSLSQAKEVSRLRSAGCSRNAAGHHSDVSSDFFADLREGGSCMLGKSGPFPSSCIVIYHKSIYQQLLQSLSKKRAGFFVPSNKSEWNYIYIFLYLVVSHNKCATWHRMKLY